MKVLQVINNLEAGGAQKLIETFVPIMKSIKGIEVDVLILSEKGNVFHNNLEKNNINVFSIKNLNLYNPLQVFQIRKYISKYDIVHVHLFPSFYWVSLAFKLILTNKPRLILTEHNTHNRRREKWYFRCVERFIYSSFDKVISISEETQKNLLNWLKLNNNKTNKFVVIPNGIDIEKIKNAEPAIIPEISKLKEDSKLICMVGSFTPQKDQETLIKCMKYLPENVYLILVGTGELMERNKLLAQKLGVEKRVLFLGFKENIGGILKTIDIVVLSSNWEGFGLAAVEGMAAGKPVIASDVPGLREVVNGYGVLFKKGDHHQLANIIKDLLTDRTKYLEVSTKCSLGAEKFTIKKMVKRYLEVYK